MEDEAVDEDDDKYELRLDSRLLTNGFDNRGIGTGGTEAVGSIGMIIEPSFFTDFILLLLGLLFGLLLFVVFIIGLYGAVDDLLESLSWGEWNGDVTGVSSVDESNFASSLIFLISG